MSLGCLLPLLLCSCVHSPRAEVAVPDERAGSDAVDEVVARVMATLHVPGIAVAIVRAGKVEKLGGYGVANLEWRAPVSHETRFQLASATKIFTGTLVMLLVQDKKLALEDPVSKYLPDAPDAWRTVTIAQLAAHASGIPSNVERGLSSTGQVVAALRARPLAFPPGTRSDYRGGDYHVLVDILERVTGQPFVELLRTRVFAPLHFTCTSFDDASDEGLTRTARVIPQRASVYRWEVDHQLASWFRFPAHTYAMGGAYSCLSDLTKWAVAMDEGTLLDRDSERRAATPLRLADGSDAGFGVAFAAGSLRGRASYGHSGGPALADIVRLPDEKLTVIVLANQGRMYPNLAPTIAGLLLPPRPETAVADARPELTRTLRAVADGYPSGQLDAAAFAPGAAVELMPALRDAGPLITAAWPRIERWSLSGIEPGAPEVRRYRAEHGPVVVRWKFTLDESGRILAIDAFPD